jgi:hypothetical protein
MFYNARWYDPSLGRFAQADTIVPSGVQGLDRYAYTFNNPIRYIDPSGHISVDCIGTNYCGANNSNLLPNGNRSSIPGLRSAGGGINNPPVYGPPVPEGYYETYHSDYMGGASPAGVYSWDAADEGEGNPSIQTVADLLNLYEMLSINIYADPTLKVFLSYFTSERGNVTNIDITIINNGESGATLESIKLTEKALPTMNSCTVNSACLFVPNTSVNIDPDEVETITICQNCLENHSTIYSYPFNNNQNNYIGVNMVLSMPIDMGNQGIQYTPIPYMYTISPR